ncbi:16S rRNA (guanine(527)-N(7))-methyltransferase RsmG [Hansschlegelia beijingensis]|uniref:16S rRNA (guanine(527)-N(7))-methyltransferase RsmG n=1 Tax=Hansschlegelia beijingensis TaxID=1133344 RepID=UPI0038280CA0
MDRTEDLAAAKRLVDVPRETWGRLESLVAALDRWQAKTNLVSPATLPVIWTRHVADSLQLLRLAPSAPRTWLDMGSGGGFPGLVVAATLGSESEVHLVESNLKKAAFLREVARTLSAGTVIHAQRAEDVLGRTVASADVVSARALAPLVQLLGLAAPLLKTGALGLFPKGKEAEAELTQAQESWRFKASLHPSLTDPAACIVRIDGFEGPR